jgi:hypothetical protein
VVKNVFWKLEPINLPCGIVCMNGRITYVYDSIVNSKFICTEIQNPFLCETLKKLVDCRIPFSNRSEYHTHERAGWTIFNVKVILITPRNAMCAPVFCVSEIHQLCRVYAWMC